MEIGCDEEQAGEDERREDGEESRVPDAIGAEAGGARSPETEREREHQADGGESTVGRDGQEA